MPPVVLCGAVEELCRCLTPLVEWGDLLDLKMLDVAKKDSAAPVCPYRGGLIIRTQSGRANWPTCHWQTIHFGACSLRRSGPFAEKTTGTPWIYPFMGGQVWPIPLEDAASPVSIPLGSQLDLSSLETLQVIVSYNTMTGEVQYQYQVYGSF